MSGNNTMTHQEFTNKRTLLATSMKQAWAMATELAAAAVTQYHFSKPKDASWCAELAEDFMSMDNNDFYKAFVECLKHTTNVKLRQDESDLSKPITAVSNGNIPTGWADQLASMQKDGLNKFGGIKGKTKGLAATMNRDWAPKPKTTEASTDADVKSLELTPLGKELLTGVAVSGDLSEEQTKQAQALAEQFNAQMKALASGEEIEIGSTAPSAHTTGFDFSEVPEAYQAQVTELVDTLATTAMAAETSDFVKKKLDNVLSTAIAGLNKAEKVAISVLAGNPDPNQQQAAVS